MSHHPTSTKEAVISNYYNTAHAVSSGPAEREHSLNMVDKLLEKNGYNKPRQMSKPRKQQSKKEVLRMATLTLPYTNIIRRVRILPTRFVEFEPGLISCSILPSHIEAGISVNRSQLLTHKTP